MNYVDRFLTYAPLTDTLDVCGGDTVPSYVRVENRHFAPHAKGRFRVYVPEDQLERLKAENAKLRKLAKNLHACNGSCPRCIELMGRCEYEEQLREFGIEAGE